MDRKELHVLTSPYFSHYRDVFIQLFLNDVKQDLEYEIKSLKGTKIPIRFRSPDVKKFVQELNTDEITFYNAFLNALIKKFSKEQIIERIEKWAESI